MAFPFAAFGKARDGQRMITGMSILPTIIMDWVLFGPHD